MKIENFDKAVSLMETYLRLKECIDNLQSSDRLEFSIHSVKGIGFKQFIGGKDIHETPYKDMCIHFKDELLIKMIKNLERFKKEIEAL